MADDAQWKNRLNCQEMVAMFNFDGMGSGGVKTNPTASARASASGFADTTLLFSGDENLPWRVVDLVTDLRLRGPALQMMSASAGKSVSVEFTLPRAQRVQFSVGGLDQSGKTLHLSGRFGMVDVKPRAFPAASTGGVEVIDKGTSVEIVPAAGGPFASPLDERAVADVVFDKPVDAIVVRNHGASSEASPWVVTRAEYCQSSDVIMWN